MHFGDGFEGSETDRSWGINDLKEMTSKILPNGRLNLINDKLDITKIFEIIRFIFENIITNRYLINGRYPQY